MNTHSPIDKKILEDEEVKNRAENLSERAKATFDLIVETAHKEFSERGYELTSIKSIADSANLSVGLIYKYFSNKEELYRYIVNAEQEAIKNYVNSHTRAGVSRLEKEKDGLRAWLHYVQANPNVYKLIWESLFFDKEAFDGYYHNFSFSYRRSLANYSDELKIEDVKNLAYMMIGMNTFLGIRIIIAKRTLSDDEIEQMVETAAEVMLKGILKDN